jgi:hypothetical protein
MDFIFAKKIALLFGLAVSCSVPAVSFALAPTLTSCPLREHHIVSAKPYYTPARVRKGVAGLRLRGVELFVEAEPGLTAEWLQLTLERDIAELRRFGSKADCVLAVESASVRVGSGGNGFHVWITASDVQNAKEIMRRAKQLLR